MKKINRIGAAVCKAAAVAGDWLLELFVTALSCVAVMLLYLVYLPVGIGRAMFSRRQIREFYADVFFIIDGFADRFARRKEGKV